MAMKKPTTIADLVSGPVRHQSLPAELVVRIENVAATLVDVVGRPAAEWVRDFQRDQNPEKEVAVWEAIAAAYVTFTRTRNPTLDVRKEVFGLLLLRSLQDEQRVLKDFAPIHLTKSEVVAVLAHFNSVATTEGWGFS
jgi:hypothetical protein